MSKCGLCHRTTSEYGVTVNNHFIPICRYCAHKIAELYNRVYEW